MSYRPNIFFIVENGLKKMSQSTVVCEISIKRATNVSSSANMLHQCCDRECVETLTTNLWDTTVICITHKVKGQCFMSLFWVTSFEVAGLCSERTLIDKPA